MQASHTEAATPVRPPKSEVPTADEESPAALEPQDSRREDDGAGFESEELPPGETAVPQKSALPEKSAEPFDQPPREQPEPAPEEREPAAEKPAAEKPPAPAANENLFDEASHQRRRSETLAKLQQQVILGVQRPPEPRRHELSRRQPLRPAASEAASKEAKPVSVRTVAHDEPNGRTKLPPPRSNPLR